MGTGRVHGPLWGARARDYAGMVEPMFCPLYERVFAETGVGSGTRLLDIGCGPGLACSFAAQQGAQPAGLDAAQTSLEIARERTPAGDFREGEMEQLPWPADTFDVITGFNAFQFADNPANALHEAQRVVKTGGRVAMAVWGRDEEVELHVPMAAIRKLLPPQPQTGPALPLSAPGRVEALLEQAKLRPVQRGEIDCALELPDLDSTIRGLMAVGPAVAAAQQVGVEAVEGALAGSLAAFRSSDGRYCLRNKLCYVIALA